MRVEGYEVEELAPGVKVYRNTNVFHTTFEHDAPWIHFHHSEPDSDSERTEVELCCHGCGVALWMVLDFSPSETAEMEAKKLRARFRRDHVGHSENVFVEDGVHSSIASAIGSRIEAHLMTFLCPSFRKMLYQINLQGL